MLTEYVDRAIVAQPATHHLPGCGRISRVAGGPSPCACPSHKTTLSCLDATPDQTPCHMCHERNYQDSWAKPGLRSKTRQASIALSRSLGLIHSTFLPLRYIVVPFRMHVGFTQIMKQNRLFSFSLTEHRLETDSLGHALGVESFTVHSNLA
jgi:hypothetical protein